MMNFIKKNILWVYAIGLVLLMTAIGGFFYHKNQPAQIGDVLSPSYFKKLGNNILPVVSSWITGSSTVNSTFNISSSTTICLVGDSCRTTWPTGSGAFPFTPTTNYGQTVYATGTPTLWFQSGMMASSTSYFANASTTQLTTTGSTYLATTGGNVGIGTTNPTYALHVVGETYSTTALRSPVVYANGYWGQASTLPTNIKSFDNYNIVLTPGSSGNTIITAGNVGIGTTGPLYKLEVNGTASSTSLVLGNALAVSYGGSGATTLTGVLKGNGTSAFTAATNGTDYTLVTAVSCTNQVMTALNASGAGTCSSVSNAMLTNSTISGVALGGTLGALSATNGTLTFSASYTGAAAATVGLNLGNANTWTGLQQFSNSTSTLFSSTYASSTTAYWGSMTVNGTINWGTNNGVVTVNNGVVSATATSSNGLGLDFYPAFSYATSTWNGTTTIYLGTAYIAETWLGVQCFTDTGTVNIDFYDGTNRMGAFNASTTAGTISLATNNTFTASEKRYVDIGTPATAPAKISCTIRKR